MVELPEVKGVDPEEGNRAVDRRGGICMNHTIENTIISAFLPKNRRERAAFELSRADKRADYIWKLGRLLDMSEAQPVIQSVDTFEDIYSILKAHGAPKDCYVLSTNERIDGQIMQLREALEKGVFCGPILISCIHGKLAYFEDEPNKIPSPRFILIRT